MRRDESLFQFITDTDVKIIIYLCIQYTKATLSTEQFWGGGEQMTVG